MKKIAIIFFSAFILVACKTEVKEEIVELHANGKVKKVEHYQFKRGKKIVIREIEYYSTGEKKMEGEMLQNQRHGSWKSYYKSGKIWSEGFFKEGLREGNSVVYYETGTKRIEGNYEKGNRIGLWKFYDEKGQKIKEVTFAADSIVSEEDFFHGIPFSQ